MIQISCPSCSRKLKLADNLQGKQIRCPACKNVFRVEAPAEAEVEIAEAVAEAPPPPPRPQPAARPAARPAPPPAEDAFADFEDAPAPPPRRRRAPAPEADFEDVADADIDLKKGRRTARRGGGALQTAFVFALLPWVAALVIIFALGGGRGMGGRDAQAGIAMIAILSIVYLIPVVFVAVGSAMLSGMRGRGMVITACIMAFITALQLLIYTGFWGLAGMAILNAWRGSFDQAMLPLLVALLSLAGCVLSIVGGIRALLTLGKPEVKAAYR